MRLGAILPNSGPTAGRDALIAAAQTAEATGADSVWVSDHLLLVDRPVSDYPFSADGQPTWSPETDWYEALACCAFLAGVTHSVRIGTATLTLAQRNVLQLAKETATIDQLSSGRLVLGVGVGWSEIEMTALGYAFERRGVRFEEMITVLRACWAGRSPQFRGEQVVVDAGLTFLPRPVRPEGPPLLVGGMSPVAIRRAATVGDGWLAIAFTDDWDVSRLLEGQARLREIAGREDNGSIARQRGAPPRSVLKLHCRDADYTRMATCLSAAREVGFDEVLVDLPWTLGAAAVEDVLGPLVVLAGRS